MGNVLTHSNLKEIHPRQKEGKVLVFRPDKSGYYKSHRHFSKNHFKIKKSGSKVLIFPNYRNPMVRLFHWLFSDQLDAMR